MTLELIHRLKPYFYHETNQSLNTNQLLMRWQMHSLKPA